MDVEFTTNGVKIFDSYKITNIDDQELFISRILLNDNCPKCITCENYFYFLLKWRVFNTLYSWGIFKSVTQNVTFKRVSTFKHNFFYIFY